MKLNDLHSRIYDLQSRIDGLIKDSLDPTETLTMAMKDISSGLEELSRQSEDLQSACLAIEAERQRYLWLFNSAPDGYLTTDMKGEMKEANLAARELMHSGLIGCNLASFLSPWDLPDLESSLERLRRGDVVRGWNASLLPSDRAGAAPEGRSTRPEGTYIPVLISANPAYDAQGKTCAILWQLHDIAGLKRAEEALSESEEMYRLLVDNANEAIIVAQDGVLKFVNPKFIELTGRSSEELISKPFAELIHPNDRDMVIAYYQKRLCGEDAPESYTFRIIGGRGDIRWIEIKPVKISWKGRPATLNFLSDITKRKIAEGRLHLFKSAVDNAREGVIILAPDPACRGPPRIEYSNQSFRRLTGYGDEDLIGRSTDILNVQDRDPVQTGIFREAFLKNEPIHIEKVTCRKDGTWFWSELSLFPLKNDDGEVNHWVSIGWDITERRRYEEEIRASRERYRDLVESIDEIIYSMDDGGVFTYISPAIDRITGYSPEEVIGRLYEEFLVEEDRADTKELFQNAISDGVFDPRDLRIIAKSGELRWFRNSIRPLVRNGRITGLSGVLTDITERKRAEEALRDSERRYRAIFENTGTAMAIIEDNTVISFVNAEFERLTGLARGEIEGKKSWREFVVKEDHLRMMEQHCLRRSDSSAAEKSYEFRFRDKGGRIREAALAITMIPGSSQSIASILDVTEQKKSEVRLAKLNDCFLNFGSLSENIINCLVALCGRLLGATCALYARLEGDVPCAIAQWNVPPDFNAIDKIAGNICRDLIGEEDGIHVVRDLQNTPYARSDQDIISYGFETYVGTTIPLGEGYIGSLCMIYQDDFTLSEEDGEFLSIVASAIGVEEKRRLAERSLRKSEEKYRELVENANSIILRLDTSGRITFINEFAQKFFGYSEEEALGKDALGLIIPLVDSTGRSMAGIFDEIASSHNTGTGTVNENIRKNGERVWIAWTNRSILDERGEPEGMLCVGNDITKRKRAEDMLAASLREKEVLLKEIHHRVKNNLQIIDSLLKVQAHYTRDERMAGVLKECHSRVRSMALVHESLYGSENLARVDFARYIDKLAHSLFSSFGIDRQKIKLNSRQDQVLLSIDKAIPCGLIANELVSNCLKYAFPDRRDGGITIDLRRCGEDVVLAISDDGIGLPESLYLQKVETMGLKLVADLVRQLKGTFNIRSAEGTCVEIVFPGGS